MPKTSAKVAPLDGSVALEILIRSDVEWDGTALQTPARTTFLGAHQVLTTTMSTLRLLASVIYAPQVTTVLTTNTTLRGRCVTLVTIAHWGRSPRKGLWAHKAATQGCALEDTTAPSGQSTIFQSPAPLGRSTPSMGQAISPRVLHALPAGTARAGVTTRFLGSAQLDITAQQAALTLNAATSLATEIVRIPLPMTRTHTPPEESVPVDTTARLAATPPRCAHRAPTPLTLVWPRALHAPLEHGVECELEFQITAPLGTTARSIRPFRTNTRALQEPTIQTSTVRISAPVSSAQLEPTASLRQ